MLPVTDEQRIEGLARIYEKAISGLEAVASVIRSVAYGEELAATIRKYIDLPACEPARRYNCAELVLILMALRALSVQAEKFLTAINDQLEEPVADLDSKCPLAALQEFLGDLAPVAEAAERKAHEEFLASGGGN